MKLFPQCWCAKVPITLVKYEVNWIHLKLFPRLADPPLVLDHQVPICVVDLDPQEIAQWDLTMQQVIPFIDGVNYVARISRLAGISLPLIRQCLAHLLYIGSIKLIDIFQFGNVYAPTPQIRRLADNAPMQLACLSCVTATGCPPPPFEKVFSLYCALNPAITFREFCQENDLIGSSIDARMFITFGIVNEFIRRIHKYPLRTDTERSEDLSQVPITKTNLPLFLNGHHNYDEICTALGITPEAADNIISDQSFVTICK